MSMITTQILKFADLLRAPKSKYLENEIHFFALVKKL